MTKKRVAIIGAGKVGSTLAAALLTAGYTVAAVSSRTTKSAKQLGERLAVPWMVCPAAAARLADLVWISTPDRMIGPVTEQLADSRAFRPGQYVYHLSGALSADVLEAAARAGVHTGVMHPLQSFASKDGTGLFHGAFFGLEGDKPAVELARIIVQDLGGQSVVLVPEQKALYHAAACVASNYLVVLLHYAVSLLQQAGFSSQDALAALLPLVRGTTGNLARQGTLGALTGPIARADAATVKKHLAAMADQQLEQRLYQILGQYAAVMAEASGSLSQEDRLAIQTVLWGDEK